ncbi:alpha/beta hydrolase family protein [Flavobacterium sp.]|uniref:alpha/beta hydrolase family protein n=1 Tax=Flavobacterium sp. TaxID=239 RepID=UPI0039E53424
MKISWLFLLVCCANVVSAQVPDSLARIFRYEKQVKMALIVDSTGAQQNVSIQKIRYSGQDHFVVSALVTTPQTSEGSHPLAVFGHWGEGDKSEFLDQAIALSARGFICILPDGPWLCPNSPITSFKRQGYEMYRQYVMNARTAIDLAQQQFAINNDKIFYIGHSFGCNAASVLSAVDARVDYFVFMAGAYSTVSNIRDSTYPDFVQWRTDDPASFEQWARRMKNLDAQYYLPYKKAACLIQIADQDEYISIAENEQFTNGTPQPKQVRHYNAKHALDSKAAEERLEWMLQRL